MRLANRAARYSSASGENEYWLVTNIFASGAVAKATAGSDCGQSIPSLSRRTDTRIRGKSGEAHKAGPAAGRLVGAE